MIRRYGYGLAARLWYWLRRRRVLTFPCTSIAATALKHWSKYWLRSSRDRGQSVLSWYGENAGLVAAGTTAIEEKDLRGLSRYVPR